MPRARNPAIVARMIDHEAAPAPTTTGRIAGSPDAAFQRLRTFLLALFVFAIIGTAAELFLLEHTESIWQWIPLALFAIGLVSAIAVWMRATPAAIRALRVVLALFIASGLLGQYLHYKGNVEFELEMRPGLKGFELFRMSIAGATPALAPGSMVLFGLIGFASTYRHPGLYRYRARIANEEES